jgi:hypothetical protein
MIQPVVFISHSCKDRLLQNWPANEPEDKRERLQFAQRVRDRIAEELGTDRTWFDRGRIEAGDDWEIEIVKALHRCRGAIVLLTPDALESPWVLREATVLADRKARWPKLALLVVLLAGSRSSDLTKQPWWKSIGLDRWQAVYAVHGAVTGLDAEADYDQIVTEVKAALQLLDDEPVDRSFEGWVQEIKSSLAQFGAAGKEGLFTAAAEALRVKEPLEWDDDNLGDLARAMLRADVVEEQEGGDAAYPLLLSIGALLGDDMFSRKLEPQEQKFCSNLEPAAAPPIAAAAIAASETESPQRPVLMATGSLDVAQLAIRRAMCRRTMIFPVTDVVGEFNDLPATAIKQLQARAATAKRMGSPTHVVIPVSVVQGEDAAVVVQDFAARLPSTTRLVAVVERGSAPTDAPLGGPVLVLVDGDEEAAAVQVLYDLRAFAGLT